MEVGGEGCELQGNISFLLPRHEARDAEGEVGEEEPNTRQDALGGTTTPSSSLSLSLNRLGTPSSSNSPLGPLPVASLIRSCSLLSAFLLLSSSAAAAPAPLVLGEGTDRLTPLFFSAAAGGGSGAASASAEEAEAAAESAFSSPLSLLPSCITLIFTSLLLFSLASSSPAPPSPSSAAGRIRFREDAPRGLKPGWRVEEGGA